MLQRLLVFLLLVLGGTSLLPTHAAQAAPQVVADSITGNFTMTNDRTWLIRGTVYVVDGATLTIEPGTVIYGEFATKGTLIVERGAKIFASGTPTSPIVFTSEKPRGQRNYGDWGGLVICGRAPMNLAAGEAQIEGGPRSKYGGNNPADNSGILRYVRIEFPGIALAPNNEINGLTLGAVGSETIIDYVQVSYSGDDAFEWFGGTVDAKHLIALRALDDNFDSDFGWQGRVQFGVALVDPSVADISGSNGFESDNNNVPNWANPRTSPMFSNMTVIGPYSSLGGTVHPQFQHGMHLRRNTLTSVYNSIFMGWPYGLYIDAAGSAAAAQNDTLQIRSTIIAGNKQNYRTNTSFDVGSWFETPAYGNKAFPLASDVMLSNPYDLVKPNFVPMSGSPALGSSDFSSGRLQNNFFSPVGYRGAFGSSDWTLGWASWDPQSYDYKAKPELIVTTIAFPNTVVGREHDSIIKVLRNAGGEPISVTSWGIDDAQNFAIQGGNAPFHIIPGDERTVYLRFTPKDTLVHATKLRFSFSDGSSQEITVTGKGIELRPAMSVTGTNGGHTHNFYLVPVGEGVSTTLTVTNTGTGDMVFGGAVLGGANSAEFRIIEGNNPGTLVPKATRKITIEFKPTSEGDKAATLSLNSNADGSPTVIQLEGKGILLKGEEIVADSIHGNVTFSSDRSYLLRGFVYVTDGSVLTIEPGTVIVGEKSTKGSLIVERGGKIMANGTPECPIVFTSQQSPGQRNYGDWGGVVICGRAPINLAAGEAQIEGGPRTKYGGNLPDDNSGVFRYVRIEFPGIALAPNNEINGLTMAGVGRGTTIDHVQVSFSGDDAFEWFGGTVNASHLVALRALDDNWDTDFGWSGNLQFGVSVVDPKVADVSGSNGIESDNNNVPNWASPRTSPNFSNMTIIGPLSDLSVTDIHPQFQHGAQLRRNTLQSVHNSIIMGYPYGLFIDAGGSAAAALGDTLQIRNTILAGNKTQLRTNVPTFDVTEWFARAGYDNSMLATASDVKLVRPFNLTDPDFRPSAGSPALTGASFANPRLAGFTPVAYRGAFGDGARWDSGWTNYDPQSTVYKGVAAPDVSSLDFGEVAVGATQERKFTLRNSGHKTLAVSSWGIQDQSIFQVVGGTAPFALSMCEEKEITVRYTPTTEGSDVATLTFAGGDDGGATVTLKGTALSLADVEDSRTRGFSLAQNTPNPFGTETEIRFTLSAPAYTRLDVSDLTGRLVATVVDGVLGFGSHTVRFDAAGLAKGIYIYRLSSNGQTASGRMVITR